MKKMLIALMALTLMIGLVSGQTVTTYESNTENMYPTNINFDSEGNLWIGSAAGFDTVAAKMSAGMEWTYYDTLDLQISYLGDDEVYDIGIADNGTVCFLTHYGISYMDAEGNVKTVENSEGTYTKGFVVDGNTLYWTYDGTPLAVLYEYDLETEQKTGEILDTDAGMTSGPTHLTVYEGARDSEDQIWLCTHWGVIYKDTEGNWHTLLDGLYPDNLISDNDGNIWVSYGSYPYNDTLVQYNSSAEVIAKYSSSDIPEIGWANGITDLEADQNGDLWMSTDSVGVVYFNGKDYTLYNEIDGLDLKKNVEDLEVNNGNIWMALYNEATIAKVEGLIEQPGGNIVSFDEETENMYPTNINFDSEGNLWIGSAAGFDTVAAKMSAGMEWTYYDTLDLQISYLGDDEVYDIGIADNGTVCFLTHYGISYMDAEGNVKTVENSEGTYTKGFVVDGNTLYWTYDGTPLAVLYEYDLETEQKTGEILDTDAGMTSGPTHLTVYEGARDSEDQIWLCTHWGVIYKDTEGNWHTLLDGLYPDNLISDNDGNIWVSYGSYPYNDTLVQYNSSAEVIAKYSSSDIPEIGWANGITDLEADQNGDLWMSTDSVGIIHFDGSDYTLHNEIGSYDVKQNVEDLEVEGGNLWLALYDPATVVKEEGFITSTAIEDRKLVSRPEKFELHQNYPNPFNPTTTISFSLKKAENVKLSIYNIQGELVKVVNNGYLNRGFHTFKWNARNYNGVNVPTGIYFYQLKSDDKMITKKMMLIR